VLVGEGIYDLGLLTPYPGLFPLHRVRVHTAFGHCFFNACLPFSAVNKERHFSCEDCNGNVSGGFDASTSQGPAQCAVGFLHFFLKVFLRTFPWQF